MPRGQKRGPAVEFLYFGGGGRKAGVRVNLYVLTSLFRPANPEFPGRDPFLPPILSPPAGVTGVQAQLPMLLPQIDLGSLRLHRTLYQLSQLSSLQQFILGQKNTMP